MANIITLARFIFLFVIVILAYRGNDGGEKRPLAEADHRH